MRNIVIVGAGGHSHAIIDVIEHTRKFSILGLLDRAERVGETVLGYPILGTDDHCETHHRQGAVFVIGIGQVKSAAKRKALFDQLIQMGATLPTIVSPFARVSVHATLGPGTCVLHGALVNASSTVGANCILNSHALVEHHANIGNHCHVATGAIINGHAQIGEGTLIGSHATVSETCQVAPQSVIGAGAVVIHSLTQPGTYVGVPAKRVGS